MAKGKKKPIIKIIVGIVIVFVVVGAIGSMGGNGSSTDSGASDATSSEQSQPKDQAKEQEPYTITDEAADTSNQYMYAITGALTNNTDSKKEYIQIEYTLYDADGNQVGTALANTNNLKAGGTWKFKAAGTASPDEVASWERSDVSGF